MCISGEKSTFNVKNSGFSQHSLFFTSVNILVDGVYRIELSKAFDVYRMESPAFGGKSLRSDDRDLFKTPTRNTG